MSFKKTSTGILGSIWHFPSSFQRAILHTYSLPWKLLFSSFIRRSVFSDYFVLWWAQSYIYIYNATDFSNCSRNEPLGLSGTGFLPAGCPSCHPANTINTLKKTQSTNPDQGKSSTGLIFPSLVTRRLRPEALLPLRQLSDAGTKAIITDKISAMLPHTLTSSNGKRSWKIRLILAPPDSSLVLISDPAPSILFSRSCPNVVIILLQYTHHNYPHVHTQHGTQNKTLYATTTITIQTLKHHDIYSITL